MVEQRRLRAYHVANRDDRKSQPIGLAGCRVLRRRAGRAHAAAEHIRTDDEEAVGVDRKARADDRIPPAVLAGYGMHVVNVLVAGQRMADQDCVGTLGVEFAVGLVGDLVGGQLDPGVELQRLVLAEAHEFGTRLVRLAADDIRAALFFFAFDTHDTHNVLATGPCQYIRAKGR